SILLVVTLKLQKAAFVSRGSDVLVRILRVAENDSLVPLHHDLILVPSKLLGVPDDDLLHQPHVSGEPLHLLPEEVVSHAEREVRNVPQIKHVEGDEGRALSGPYGSASYVEHVRRRRGPYDQLAVKTLVTGPPEQALRHLVRDRLHTTGKQPPIL